MNDTTLIIPAWRRPDYLKAVLASWHEVRGAHELRKVIIALGRGHEAAMQEVISASPLPAPVLKDSDRAHAVHGPHSAIGEAIVHAFADEGCGFVIVSDEDCIVSDDTLDYFAWARGQDVAAVCAHNEIGQAWCPRWDDTDADQAAVRIRPEFTGWTWGIPRVTWDEVFGPEWDWDESTGPNGSEHGFDWQCHRLANRGLRVAIPDASRSQNIGQHGGVYAHPDQFHLTQAKSFRERRGQVAYRVAEVIGSPGAVRM